MNFLDYSLIGLGYLIGSLSTAIIVCKLMRLPDPRTQGSGNPGATNVLRVGGKKAAAITLLGDMLKGLLPVLLAKGFAVGDITLGLVGLAAFLGHLYPIFFGFKGGKGVATMLGVLLGINIWTGLATSATWLLMVKLCKISSLSALIAMALAPVYLWFITQSIALTGITAGTVVILYWRHRSNIENLLKGTEGRLGEKQ